MKNRKGVMPILGALALLGILIFVALAYPAYSDDKKANEWCRTSPVAHMAASDSGIMQFIGGFYASTDVDFYDGAISCLISDDGTTRTYDLFPVRDRTIYDYQESAAAFVPVSSF